jgi:hypothetical protein
MNERLLADARVYASRYQLEIGEILGSGKDGIVVAVKNKEKAADVALKVFRFDEAYRRERDVYHRLKNRQIQQVGGFNVPQFIASDDNLRAIEMTIVSRPFVLDFAGAYLDKRPEFPAEVWADWEAEKREQFEERWSQVQAVLEEFEQLRIYLLDLSPANIAFSTR